MKRQMPARRWRILAVLIAALTVSLLYFRNQDSVEWIPVPTVSPSMNTNVTIQWESRQAAQNEFSLPAENHPGYKLSQMHCVRCHLLPDPNQLPRESWPFVFTWMANYLGYRNTYGPFTVNVNQSLIPPAPLVSESELRQIADYYLIHSMSREQTPKDENSVPEITQFGSRSLDLGIPDSQIISLLDYDTETARLYVGDATRKSLQIHDNNGRLLNRFFLESEPVKATFTENGFRLTTLGDLMTDRQKGELIEFGVDAAGRISATKLVTNYHRLTQTLVEDFDNNGAADYLMIGFGEGEIGKVSVFWGEETETKPKGESILVNYSGALNAVTHDFNDDGLKDIMVLTAQSKQELLLFLNKSNRQFEQRTILKKFAGFGFNHLSIADFNQDGLMDLMISNGNNMEIKDAPLKPYHGIRIYENLGNLQFAETYFYRFDGSLKSIAEDFDLDGDLDIASISLYPDWSQEFPQTFVYLENEGDYKFSASKLPSEDWGRWITMTTGDTDQDGYVDILLGGGYISYGVHESYREKYNRISENRPSVVILDNVGNTDDRDSVAQ